MQQGKQGMHCSCSKHDYKHELSYICQLQMPQGTSVAAVCWVECMPGQRVGAQREYAKGKGG